MADQDRAGWTKMVADFETSDLSQREFAKERMLSLSNLRYWVYRLRKESRPLVTEPTERSVNKAERRPAKKGLILKPVRVVGSAAKPRRGEDGDGLLELALPSGTRLRFQAGTDPGCLYLHSSNRPNTIDDSAWWLNSPRLNDLPRRGLRSDAPLAPEVSTRPGGREPGPPAVGTGNPIPWTDHGASAPAGFRIELETLKTGRAPVWTRR